MKKLSEKELRKLLVSADRKIPVGSRIKHRESGGIYHVMSIALREVDLVPLISYRREDSAVSFSRPIGEIAKKFTLVTAPGGEVEEWF